LQPGYIVESEYLVNGGVGTSHRVRPDTIF
jgi:hypothetical protein